MKKSYNLVKIMFNRLFVYVTSLFRKRNSRKEKMEIKTDTFLYQEHEMIHVIIKEQGEPTIYGFMKRDKFKELLTA